MKCHNTIYKCSEVFTSLGKQKKEDADASYYYYVEGTYNIILNQTHLMQRGNMTAKYRKIKNLSYH
jgi:hypothetical protein